MSVISFVIDIGVVENDRGKAVGDDVVDTLVAAPLGLEFECSMPPSTSAEHLVDGADLVVNRRIEAVDCVVNRRISVADVASFNIFVDSSLSTTLFWRLKGENLLPMSQRFPHRNL